MMIVEQMLKNAPNPYPKQLRKQLKFLIINQNEKSNKNIRS